MFKHITHISDVQPHVAHKEEIRFYKQPNGITMSLYLFMDSKTFDSPEARECRGAAFDEEGNLVSRPLHKFFNMGEKDYLTPEKLKERTDVAAVFDKLDGSMVATAWVKGLAFEEVFRFGHCEIDERISC
jgi:RNA ligase